MTINLTINDIPDFLKDSELCKNIVSDESFDIPIELFRKDIIINTCQDLIDYIRIFDYWMINKIPDKFYKFIFGNKDKININLLNDLFPMNDLIKQIEIIIDDTFPSYNTYKLCCKAASNGYLDCLKYAYTHENLCQWNKYTCSEAASNGHLDCLKYAHENGCPWDNETCSKAAENGHLDCLMYAHENGCEWDSYTCSSASTNGHLGCLKYAYENGCPFSNTRICYLAARYGHLDCLKYAHENGCSWDEETCNDAAENGHLECLKYAHENGCEWDEYTCSEAASNGHLECLKYAHENGCEWDYKTCRDASKNGHLECLKYAHENGCEWLEEEICNIMIKNDQLECLKYALDNGCLLDEEIFIQLASKNNFKALKFYNENYPNRLDISKFIIINKYKWNKTLTELIAFDGNLEALQIYRKYGCPWLVDKICSITAENGHLNCLKYAFDNSCSINEIIFIELASKNNFEALKFFDKNYPDKLNISNFIVVNNYKWDKSLTALIAFNGNLEALKIYRKYGCPWDKRTTFYAIKRGHYDCFKYAIENDCPIDRKKCMGVINKLSLMVVQ
jgi:hypothetical protein